VHRDAQLRRHAKLGLGAPGLEAVGAQVYVGDQLGRDGHGQVSLGDLGYNQQG